MATGAEASRSRSAAPQRGTRGAGKRRRPSGEPPPLPRRLGVSGRVWIALAVSLLAVVGLILAYRVLGAGFDRWDSVVLRGIVPVRTGWLTTVMVGINTALASRWTVRILRLGTLVALVGLRRWRHLITFLGSVIVVELAAYQLAIFQARVRPFGVTIAGSWDGFSFPSPAVAALAVTLVGMAYALLPSGRPRSLGKWAAGALLLLAGLARAYLAVDNPSDLVSAVILGGPGVGSPCPVMWSRSAS